MTSTPDQSPAATEVAKVPATDPVETAPADEAEQDPVPGDVVGESGSEDGTGTPDTADAGASDEPTSGPDDATAEVEPAAHATAAAPGAPAGDVAGEDLAGDVAGDEPAATSDEEPAGDAGGEPAEDDESADVADDVPAADVPGAAAGVPEARAAQAEPAADSADTEQAVEAAAADVAAAPEPADAGAGAEAEQAADEDSPSAPVAADPAAEDAPVEETPAPADAPAAAPEVAQPVRAVPEPPRRPKPDAAPTEEISVVPDAVDAEADADATTPQAAGTAELDARTPSDGKAGPAVDETLDFKALSFAAITEAHKKALGPRTVAGDAEAADEQQTEALTGDASADTEEAPGGTEARAAEKPTTEEKPAPGERVAAEQQPTAETTVPAAERTAPAESAAPTEAPELFASPTTRIPPVVAPPSPFPTPAGPPQHQPGVPPHTQGGAPQQPPSPFPSPRGGAGHSFPAVHGYAPEATYAGWRPSTEADDAARRRRIALIGGAVAAVVAVVVVIVLVVNMVSKQQWEPIEAMIAEPREVHPLQLVLGSCVETMPEDGEVSEVLAVPCDASHTAQVVGRTDFADAAVWPGRDQVDKRVAQVCGTKQLGPIARTSQLAGSVSYVVWGPSEESWADGDRVGLCLATTDEPITQDLLQ